MPHFGEDVEQLDHSHHGCIATLVKGLKFINKINIAILWLSNSTRKYLLKISKIYPRLLTKAMGKNGHSSFIYNRPKLKIFRVAVSRGMA